VTGVPVRGQVYRADLGAGPRPWLIVSNNHRNRQLNSVIGLRITTSDRHAELPTWVKLSGDDPLVGYVLADDLENIRRAELAGLLGTLSPKTVLAVNAALKLALAVP
jgi:mRNA interferase MazF